MKKILILLTVLTMTVVQAHAAKTTFSNAYAQNGKKPMMVLVYAKWADGYQNTLTQFRKVQQKYGNTYNFVELDIANQDAKLYSEKFVITSGLPYVMLFRNNCKVSRYIDRNCASSASCIISKSQFFIN